MSLPEENELPQLNPEFGDESEQKQRRQMLIALALLLLALILVLVKDREFWFPSAPPGLAESEPLEQTAPEAEAQPQQLPATTALAPPTPVRPKAKARPAPPAAAIPGPAPALAPVVTNRAVLPPLEVEVVAGDERRTVQAGTNSVRVDLQPRTPVIPSQASLSPPLPAPSSQVPGGLADGAGRVHLSPGAAEIISRPVEPNYPLLAKQMKVQGAVVLEALIGRDGNIQDLHVLSGPTILSAAAREAVKQWRFRPYLLSGQAVETEARITVNFTISTQ
jgi:periplasmic protein TonB